MGSSRGPFTLQQARPCSFSGGRVLRGKQKRARRRKAQTRNSTVSTLPDSTGQSKSPVYLDPGSGEIDPTFDGRSFSYTAKGKDPRRGIAGVIF